MYVAEMGIILTQNIAISVAFRCQRELLNINYVDFLE